MVNISAPVIIMISYLSVEGPHARLNYLSTREGGLRGGRIPPGDLGGGAGGTEPTPGESFDGCR